MPVKRRNAKRRLSAEAEMEVWVDVFETGFDFFGEVEELTGLQDPRHVRFDHQRVEAERLWQDAIMDAWTRLGEQYLAGEPQLRPWALLEFGRPWEAQHAA